MRSDLLLRLRSLFRPRRVEQELDEELRFHFEHEIEKHVKSGVNSEEAARRARLAFGGMDQIKEECREARGITLIGNIAQDVRYAFRALRKSPAFAGSAILTLALGVAATTAAFSVVDSIVLNPIPFKDADRLVEIYSWSKTGGGPGQSPLMLRSWREQSQIFDQVEAYRITSFVLAGSSDPEILDGSQVTTGMFRFLGVRAELGRDFEPDDSNATVAVISHDLWVGRFGSDANVLGRTVHLNDDVFTIIGVMPAWFRFPYADVHIWTPFDPSQPDPRSPIVRISPVARIRKGLPLEQADAQVARLAPQIDEGLSGAQLGTTARLNPMNRYAPNSFRAHAADIRQTRTTLFLILGAAGLVLLASCVNSANLFLSRAVSRSHEMAVRAAIGGSRLRLICHVLTEALVIAILAGSLGALFANWSLRGLAAIIPADLVTRSLKPFGLGGNVGICAALASLGAGLIAALIPMLKTARGAVITTFRGRSEGSLRSEIRLRGLFIAIETALALMLMVGAGLMARTLWTLAHVDAGWSPGGFTVVEPQFRGSRYGTPESRNSVMTRLADRFRTTPGVEAVSLSDEIPLKPGSFSFGTMETGEGQFPNMEVTVNHVSEGYFKTLGIPLRIGHAFESSDGLDSAVISQQLAERLWPGVDPLGKRFHLIKVFDWVTVIGVVGDVHATRVFSNAQPLQIYRPFSTQPDASQIRYLALKTDARMATPAALRNQVRQLDPNLPADIQPIRDIYAGTLSAPIFHGMLFAAFALLTVLLAIAGVYAVVIYEVSRRTQEIGIRVALGATPGAVIMQVMRPSLVLAGTGLVAGLGASVALTKFMSAMLYQVKPTDPETFAAAALLIIAAVGIAGYIPARRASRVDPAVALRND